MTQEQLNGLWKALGSTTSIQPNRTGKFSVDGHQFLYHEGRLWERKSVNAQWTEVPPLQGNL